jgi:site-specific recombinase XerD
MSSICCASLPGPSSATRPRSSRRTTRVLRLYKTALGERQKPSSVNAALAAQRHFFSWAFDTQRINRDPKHLSDVAAQALAPAGLAIEATAANES